MTEFETQCLAGQQILIRQLGQIATDIRMLRLHVEKQPLAQADLLRLIEEAGGLEAVVRKVAEQNPQ